MTQLSNASRRRFLAQTGIGFAALASLPSWLRAMENMDAMPKLTPNKASPNFHPDVELAMVAKLGEVAILPGQPTRVFQYCVKLIKGPAHTVTALPGSYLGPILRFEKGQKIRVTLYNKLEEPTITHWHGLHVSALMDGHPVYAIDKGEQFVYEFEMLNRASLNIYHPHPHNITASQVYYGLAGGILVNDEKEKRLGLPSGDFEVPLVIQDKRFDSDNQLVYVQHMHDRMFGFYGDRILVNGRPDFHLDVASRAYRFRVLNGSTARIYKLAWDDGTPLTVIGTDGGLLEKPVEKPYVMLAPGERLDLWADFSGRAVGSQLVLRSRPFSGVLPKMVEHMMMRGGARHGMGMGMMGGMGIATTLPVGSDYPIMTVKVTRAVSDSPSLPKKLTPIPRYRLSDTANPNQPVPVGISEGPMSMLLNGRPYAYKDFLPSERIPFNTVQLLEIFHAHGGSGGHGAMAQSDNATAEAHDAPNNRDDATVSTSTMPGMKVGRGMGMGMGRMHGMAGRGPMSMRGRDGDNADHEGMAGRGGMGMGGMGMRMSMAHPIHFHGQYFQILSRTIGMGEGTDYATVKEGFVDSGWKDTVLVMPGERVRIIKPFEDFKGVFMFHCHNLEHEDLGMMREFLIE